VTLLEIAPQEMTQMVDFMAQRRGKSRDEYLDSLARVAQTFASLVRGQAE